MVGCRRIRDALKVLDEMHERGDECWVSWIVFSGLVNGGVEDEEVARVVGRLGEKYGLVPNPLTRKGEFVRMNVFIREMKEIGIVPNVVTFGILVNNLCKSSRVDQAMVVFERMSMGEDEVKVKRDVVIYNNLIDGLCKVGRHDDCLALMERMMSGSEDGCVPNAVTHGKINNAVELLDKIKDQRLKGTEVTHATLIGAFCSVNNIGRAMRLFDEMKRTCNPDAIVYYTLISGLCQAGRLEDADRKFEEMKKAGFSPDARIPKVQQISASAGTVLRRSKPRNARSPRLLASSLCLQICENGIRFFVYGLDYGFIATWGEELLHVTERAYVLEAIESKS
ncbi:Pentatricopeptide repeat-containing protein [Drosera capensis]